MNRPVLWATLTFLAGTCAGAWGLCPGYLVPVGLAVAGILMPVFMRGRAAAALASIILVFFGAGALLWNAHHAGLSGDPLARFVRTQPRSTAYTLEGKVERPDVLLPGRSYMQFFLRVDAMELGEERRPLEGGVLVRWSDPDRPLFSGDRVRVRGRLELELSRVNWNTPSFEDHLRIRDIHTALRLKGKDAVELTANGAPWSFYYWASRLRATEALMLSRVVPEPSLPFVLTVWLGDRRSITNEVYRSFVESGTAHILAVSGVHVGIVFAALSYALGLLTSRRRLRLAVILGVILLYVLVAGARIATVRVAIMIALYLLAEFFDRESDAPTALSIAAMLFTLHDPDVLFDTGFRLSFLSIASILLFGDPIESRLNRLPHGVRKGFATVLAVQVLALPVAIASFHVLPLAGPLANLAVIPLLFIVLCLCFLATLCAPVTELAALLIGHAMGPPVLLIQRISEQVASFGGSHVNITAPTTVAMVGYWGTVGFVVLLIRARRFKGYFAAAALVTAAATVALWSPLSTEAEIHFLDVGKGDATFIRTPGGTTILVDGGDRKGMIDMGERVVAPFLWSNHVSRLDGVVATHADLDHTGGLNYVLEHFPVGTLYLGPFPSDTTAEQELLDLCATRGVEVRRVARGDTIPARRASLEVLHPPKGWTESDSDNNRSVTIRASWPGVSVLLTGDIEAAAETALAGTDCRADIVKAPHHGSRTSSTAGFVEAVNPLACVVSTGGPFREGSPDPKVLERYRSLGAVLHRTDFQGGIRVSYRNDEVFIEGAREERGYLARPVR